MKTITQKFNFTLMILMVSGWAFITSCSQAGGNSEDTTNQTIAEENGFHLVEAAAETKPVETAEDAADDITIWYNPADPGQSTIIGTNKQKGLVVYNLEGEELYNYPIGQVNNVDIRSGFNFGGDTITIVGATNRTNNSLTFMKVNPADGSLTEIPTEGFKPKSSGVYGFCMYATNDPKYAGRYYAISVGTDGKMDQWELQENNGKLKGRFARIVKFDSQCEGLVADDETGFLYVGEESKGIWKMPALPASGDKKELIADVAKSKLEADVEGLAIYYGRDNKGYLLASSQGNNSFAVFTREEPNKYLGSFMIVSGGSIDGTSDTDGIDVLNPGLGSAFPDGVFIAQDGYNYDGEALVNQNFKLVSWKEIAKQFEPWLLIDNSYRK